MLKFIVTRVCGSGCQYCITKNLKIKESTSLTKLEKLFKKLSKQHKEIMFTGGEPMQSKLLWDKVSLAQEYFWGIHITTADPKILNAKSLPFRSIVFSIHDFPVRKELTPKYFNKVFASILVSNFDHSSFLQIVASGFAGLTLNENQRDNDGDSGKLQSIISNYSLYKKNGFYYMPDLDFSIKINRKGHCLNETIILPDYSLTNNFEEYL